MLYIGDLVGTHGIKGEVKIISNFKYKSEVFNINSVIYIKDTKYIIKTHRVHKNYDLLTLEGIDNINDVLHLKNSKVFINREDYKFSGILNEDLYGKKVYNYDKYIGILDDIIQNPSQELFVIKNEGKRYLIPYVDEFIEKIDDDIHLKLIKGLIDED
ncbi:MAG: 16S rRNA processing protein RimM [Bacilli bacterium]|nr:16S rRNA processing protein RimM [Bacilli bacterium]MBR3209460.1 16S rRNA processing protein RimM [Bacilli bacterium]